MTQSYTPYDVETPNSPTAQGDYCIAELFKNGVSTLLINFSNISQAEIASIATGNVEVGMTVDNDDIILFWAFNKNKNETNIITPFDARSYEGQYSLTIESPKVEIHLVESTKKALIATRTIELPPAVIQQLKPAIDFQLSGNAKPVGSHNGEQPPSSQQVGSERGFWQ